MWNDAAMTLDMTNVIWYNGAKGEQALTASQFIAQHLSKKTGGTIDSTCAFCGMRSQHCFPIKDILSANFNDHKYMRHDTDHVCDHCASCLDSKTLNGKALRNYSVIATESGITSLARNSIHRYIIEPPAPPFVFMVTFTHKKHIFFHARVNYAKTRFQVATDRIDIEIDPIQFKERYNICSRLYDASFSKAEIASNRYRKWNKIEKFGAAQFSELNKQIDVYRGSFYLDFLLHILQKENT